MEVPKTSESGAFGVLIVGDGNFSFAVALCRQIWPKRRWVHHPERSVENDNVSISSLDSHFSAVSLSSAHSGLTAPDPNCPGLILLGEDAVGRDIYVTATSFDKGEEVVSKYPESVPLLARLHRFKNATVLHQINAWTLLDHFPEQRFDLVLWNHPHLGVEDCRLHRLLLAHYFHSAARVLKPNGAIAVTLVNGQDELWDVRGQAGRIGLRHISSAPFFGSDYPGYISKRNKNGESFKNHHTLTHHGHDMWSATHRFAFPNENTNGGGTSTGLAITLQRKKVVAKDHECPHCFKRFKCMRGLSVHVRQVHELKKYGDDWRPDREKTLACTNCDKVFGTDADLWQHKVSQHKFDVEVPGRPETQIDGVDLSQSSVPMAVCDICGAHVPPGSGLDVHLENLKPVPPLDLSCDLCGDKFIEDRALRQACGSIVSKNALA